MDLFLPRNFENIVTSMENLSWYGDPRKIKMQHIVLKLGFSFKNLADIATLDSFKKGLDTHNWMSEIPPIVWKGVLNLCK